MNVISLLYCAIAIVFFFPSAPTPATVDMNWAIAVFEIMLVIAIGSWFTQGRRSYLRTEDPLFRVVSGRSQPGQATDRVDTAKPVKKTTWCPISGRQTRCLERQKEDVCYWDFSVSTSLM